MSAGGFRYFSASCTHAGMVRTLNEDACLDRPDLGLWAVADGMGGHDAGDFASRLIVESLGRISPPVNAPAFLSQVKSQLIGANRDLRAEAERRGPGRIIASTVVVLLAYRHHFACVWAGDSRLYLWRAAALRQVTRDHSHVQEMVDIGALTPEEAERHPQANIVTRAVGGADRLDFEMRHERILPGALFLLCSDGLTRMLSDGDIASLLARTAIGDAAETLVDAALARGGMDNVTIVLVQCREGDPA